MARRADKRAAFDFFPTPPWATRALLDEVLFPSQRATPIMSCWEPACGAGHMALPLSERFHKVFASDIQDLGFGDRRDLDFAFANKSDAPWPVDWIITNPPYILAERMLDRALAIASIGVAMLLRLQWLEGAERYSLVFGGGRAPWLLCPFADRVPMIEGVWDPRSSSATAYAWFVWIKGWAGSTVIQHIRPGAAERWTRMQDLALAVPGEAERRRKARKA